ncbi:MAG: hypothetical protein Q7T01_04055 [bacterium]|nr:hypothetical protein [bacterium]
MCSLLHIVCEPMVRGWEDVAHHGAHSTPRDDAFFAGASVKRVRVAPGITAYVAEAAERAIIVAARSISVAHVALARLPVRGDMIRAGTTHYVVRVSSDPSLLPPRGAHRW